DQRDREDDLAPVRTQQVAEQPPAPLAQQRGQPSADLIRPLGREPPPGAGIRAHALASRFSTSISAAYSGFDASSCRWLPLAAITPPDGSATVPASATGDGRCATPSAVEPARISCSALVTRSSVCTSSAES